MQSSLVTALRTLMMLLSLTAVPLAAVFGSGSWPRVREKLEELRQQVVAKLDPTPPRTTQEPLSLGVEPMRPLTVGVPQSTGGGSSTPWSNGATDTPAPPTQAHDHALAGPIAESSGPQAFVPLATVPTPTPFPVHVDPQMRPASFVAENATPPTETVAPNADRPPAGTHAPAGSDRVDWIQHRLQTLGAAWYRLETAGNHAEMFRFQCKMTSPTNPNYVRYFEATSVEPVDSMQHVLDQVDAWVASREPPLR